MDLSVIIPVRDHAADLRELLGTLYGYGFDGLTAEVIVVDDRSKESILPLCTEFGALHIRMDVGEGPARARNRGVEESRGSILLLLDADVVPAQGMLAAGVAALRADPTVLSVSFINQAYQHGDSLVRNFGAAQEHYWFRKYFKGADEPYAFCGGVTTRNALVRRDAFEAIGGFCTAFRTNAIEDYDFGKRLAARGPTIILASPLIYHKFPKRLGRLLRNYWVRVSLYIPYRMRNRAISDSTQLNPSEGALRLLGALSSAAFVLGLFLGPWNLGVLWLGLAGLTVYCAGVAPLLMAMRRSGAGLHVLLGSLFIHLLSSVVIVAGAARGLVIGLSKQWSGRD